MVYLYLKIMQRFEGHRNMSLYILMHNNNNCKQQNKKHHMHTHTQIYKTLEDPGKSPNCVKDRPDYRWSWSVCRVVSVGYESGVGLLPVHLSVWAGGGWLAIGVLHPGNTQVKSWEAPSCDRTHSGNSIVLHHDLISHSITLSWHWANQFLPYPNKVKH